MGKDRRRQPLLSKLADAFKKLDQFGEDVGFTLKDGSRQYFTIMGSLVSLVIFAVIVAYGYQKQEEMFNYTDSKIAEKISSYGMHGAEIPFTEINMAISIGLTNKSTLEIKNSDWVNRLLKVKLT